MKKKKWIIWLVVVAAILAVASMAYNHLSTAYANENETENSTEESTPVKDTKNKASDFTVYDENKNKVNLSDYIGKPVVVNFWAS